MFYSTQGAERVKPSYREDVQENILILRDKIVVCEEHKSEEIRKKFRKNQKLRKVKKLLREKIAASENF